MSGLADLSLSLGPSARVEFGVGAVVRLPAAVRAAGTSRVLLVSDPGLRAVGMVERVVALLEGDDLVVHVFDRVAANPTTAVVDEGAALARDLGGAAVVGLGGGSSLDAAKAIALHGGAPGLPVVAVPTTAGTGAETNGFGVFEDTAHHRKVYLGDDSVRPRVAVLDPELTVGLPPGPTAATGMDALVHAIESLASRGSTPFSEAYATEAVRLVAANLERAVEDGTDLEARSSMLIGSHLAGRALSLSGLGLVHGIGHAVTNHTGAVHGLALGAVLDRVMAATSAAAGCAYARVELAMGVASGSAVEAVAALATKTGTRLPLRDLGVTSAQVPSIAAGALADAVSANHPRTFTQDEVERILTDAW